MRFPTTFSLALVTALAATPATIGAQAVVQPLPGTTDADRLADTMRRLALSPTDLGALLDAGELSLKVDDLSGAASLFARADRVDPRNARAKAGMAAILVRAERPGEALRYFAQAEALGIAPARIAADRGLAYDLIGEPDRAQRDYRMALRGVADDETARRYALSLGISGRREQALAVLDPLVRRSDRGAWRARAFVLAMTGDVAGANTIATTMMPSGMAQGLQPFFQRLPSLGAADRAFAVHFGEVRATPERLADARLTPALTPLPPEPQLPVALAAAVPAPTGTDRGRRRDGRGQPGRVEVAAVQPNPPSSYAAPLPRPSAPAATPQADPARVSGATQIQPSTSQQVSRPVAVAAASSAGTGATAAYPTSPVHAGFGTSGATPAPPPALVMAQAQPELQTAQVAPTQAAPVVVPLSAPPTASPAVRPAPRIATAGVASPRSAPSRTAPPPVTRPAQDSVLARIIANLSVPGAELDVRSARVPSAAVAEARARVAEDSAARRAAVSRIAAVEPTRRDADPAEEQPTSTRRTSRRGKAVEVADAAIPTRTSGRGRSRDRAEQAETGPVDGDASDDARGGVRNRTRTRDRAIADSDVKRGRSARGRTELGDTEPLNGRESRGRDAARAGSNRRGADKAAERKAERRAERAEPERIWVQVATGANEGDLPKAWSAVRGKAPDAFKGRAGYTAPLRATNRVVTGPFKTPAEAQAFVNGLARKGLSASTFTSDAGQKVSKLPSSK